MRVFPLSNWTELDIWQYIYEENISLVSLYFAKERPVVVRDGLILVVDDGRMRLSPAEQFLCRRGFSNTWVLSADGAIPSNAGSVKDIIVEVLSDRHSERQG
ncbi:hypothetical protein AJ87_13555 [Rhizobium yanglingense]|nr:hypothetical protein AJ87_13555 [Rhizobium yanglingense]